MPEHASITQLLPGFLEYMVAERHFQPTTVQLYRKGVAYFVRLVADLPVQRISLQDFISLKSAMIKRGVSEQRIAGIINAMKCFLVYARDVHRLSVLDLSSVKAPRAPRRQVTYLTGDELQQFCAAIPLRNWRGEPRLTGYCFLALVETLAATGIRISEALALNRDSINLETKETMIIGKRRKQRKIYFTTRALESLKTYLKLRKDSSPALFAGKTGKRLTIAWAEEMFRRHTRIAASPKRITPHIIRHTMATNLLRNGCPIGFIKEILGHEHLETTCRYYLGILTQADVKNAHAAYADFVRPDIAAPPVSTGTR